MFGPGIIIAGGCCVAVALLDKLSEDCGVQWVGTTLKILIPVLAMAASVYFLQTNMIHWWLR